MTKRCSFSDKFKATVALDALRGDRTAHEIAAKHKVHLSPSGHRIAMSREATQVTAWKRQAIDHCPRGSCAA